MEQSSLKKIKEFVGENGLVAFEHGFKQPTFEINGDTYKVLQISDTRAYCLRRCSLKRNATVFLSDLPERVLDMLHDQLIKYLEYCQTEA